MALEPILISAIPVIPGEAGEADELIINSEQGGSVGTFRISITDLREAIFGAGVDPYGGNLTIATDQITLPYATRSFYGLLPESGTTDDLSQMIPHPNMKSGTVIHLQTGAASRTITVKHNTGGAVSGKFYILKGASNPVLDNQRDVISFMLGGVGTAATYWILLNYQDNANA